MLPVQVEEVVGLEGLVGELGEGAALFAVEAGLDAVPGEHALNPETGADLRTAAGKMRLEPAVQRGLQLVRASAGRGISPTS